MSGIIVVDFESFGAAIPDTICNLINFTATFSILFLTFLTRSEWWRASAGSKTTTKWRSKSTFANRIAFYESRIQFALGTEREARLEILSASPGTSVSSRIGPSPDGSPERLLFLLLILRNEAFATFFRKLLCFRLGAGNWRLSWTIKAWSKLWRWP